MIFQIKVDGQSFIPTHMQTCDATVMAKFNASAVFRYAVIIRWVLLLSDYTTYYPLYHGMLKRN